MTLTSNTYIFGGTQWQVPRTYLSIHHGSGGWAHTDGLFWTGSRGWALPDGPSQTGSCGRALAAETFGRGVACELFAENFTKFAI